MDRLLIDRIERASDRAPIRQLSDDALIERYREGDEQAFAELFERYHAEVVAYCTRFLGDRGEADDAAQQAFISAHGFMRRNNTRIAFRQWIYTIARHKSLSLIRSRKQHLELHLDEISRQSSLAAAVEAREEFRDVVEDLHRLPEEQRSAMTLAQLDGMRGEDIAEILGCSHERVRALIFQARQSLIARREARRVACAEVRAHIESLTKRQLSGLIRRHVDLCDGCAALWHDRRNGVTAADGHPHGSRQRARRLVAGAAIALAALLVGRGAIALAGAEPWSRPAGSPDARMAELPGATTHPREERRDADDRARRLETTHTERETAWTEPQFAVAEQAPSPSAPPTLPDVQRQGSAVGDNDSPSTAKLRPVSGRPDPATSPVPDADDGDSPAQSEAPPPAGNRAEPPPVYVDGELPIQTVPDPVVPDEVVPDPIVPDQVVPDPVVPDLEPGSGDPNAGGGDDPAAEPEPAAAGTSTPGPADPLER